MARYGGARRELRRTGGVSGFCPGVSKPIADGGRNSLEIKQELRRRMHEQVAGGISIVPQRLDFRGLEALVAECRRKASFA
jgi:hypothetical protein